ncbi:MAG: M4 family metallopeptidase [Anaerolineales bacterium]|nr:M4 family metallopeptidase [Anaerolineales bacterium]
MPHTRAWSLLASLLFVATLLPAPPPSAAAPPPPDLLARLASETGGALRVSHHPRTGQVNFLALSGGRAWQPSAAATAAAPEAAAEAAARQFLAAYGSVFGLQGRPDELEVLRSAVREDGRSYVRFQQTAAGVPVFGGELIVQVSPAGGVEAVLGKALPNLTAPAQPALTAAEAQAAALESVAAAHDVAPQALRATEPALWLYNPVLTEPHAGPTRLVWRLEVVPVELLPIRQLVLIDARRGSVALQFNQVDYTLNRLTYDANNNTLLPGTLRCNESNPACTGGDAHEVAAHTYAGDTYDFYQGMHARDSIDGAGLTLTSTVHYGFNYDNAFWNGAQMVYGDAYGFALADDVVAHELTHGVTQYESNLFYYYQSGAINESLSDVWGELLDLTNGAGDDSAGVRWDLGEDITGLGAIRDMADPTLFGDPDRMTSANYKSASGDVSPPGPFDNGGVHTNSGVNNKAAYLMVDGGAFNGLSVSPLGITKTATIYYHTATNLLTSGSDYLDLYNALYQSCATLVGTAGITAGDCQEVRDATEAVEMDEQPLANYNTHAPLCPPGQSVATTLFFDNLEASAANWTTGALAGTNRWSRNADFAYSGAYALLGNDFPAATSDSFAAMNASVAVTTSAYLHFQHAYGFEGASADGGIVEYSTNGGASWTSAGGLFDFNGYDGAISTGPLAGSQGFIADSHGYISSRLRLEPLAGQNVRFRFRMGLGTFGADMGWWVDDVRIYTCSGSPVPTLRTYLPGVMRNSGVSGAWEILVQEGFEGAWPNGLWVVDEPGYNQYFWARRDCRAATGGFSAWAMGGGSLGSGLGCGADYVDYANAWMVYGPVNLNGSTAAEFNLSLWLQTEPDFDFVYLMASIDGNMFYGTRYTGSTSGAFSPVSLDLKNVFTLGDVTDDASTWVAVLFESDVSVVEAEGAHVDDVVLRRCTAAACPSTGLSLGAAHTLVGVPAALARSAANR